MKIPGTAPLRRFGRSVARLARTRYPAFVFGGEVPRGEIPVFTYHDVRADVLRADLEFLAANGYRTVRAAEFHSRMLEDGAGRERLVLLAFDDARRNFWEVAYPLLAAHRAHAVLFVPSYWVGDSARMFMTWDELRECRRAGLVDVESHAHRHALVYTSPRLAGFASPAALARHDLFDWPMRRERDGDRCGYPPLGTPIYESAPLLSAERRLLEPAAAVQACRELVATQGAERFFGRPGWQERLLSAHDSVPGGPRLERISETATRALAATELAQAAECFERELGSRPRFFAYPWMLGSADSQGLLRDLGLVASFGVALDFRRARRERSPLPAYGRYKSDWLRFLPGQGRRRLRDVVPQKCMRFVSSQHLAH